MAPLELKERYEGFCDGGNFPNDAEFADDNSLFVYFFLVLDGVFWEVAQAYKHPRNPPC